jgi:flagellum-specific peptidoglycan hydrolase FlgJ
MAVGDLLFAFDPKKGESPQSVAKKRQLAEAIMGRSLSQTPRNIGEGLSAVGNAILVRKLMGQSESAEGQGQSAASKVFKSLFQPFPEAPAASAAAGSAAASSANADNPNLPSKLDFARDSAPVDLSDSKEAFVASLMPAALEASKRTGVDPRIIVAQAAQETGWGKSAPGNNFFGIKSHGKEGGQTFGTHEVINGKRVAMRDSFRKFNSPGDSVQGYADFLLENPRYKPMMAAQGLDAQLQALGASGYATDPNYAQSVGAIARGLPMPDLASAQAPAETQVASLDPSVGMGSIPPAPRPVPPEYANAGLSPEAWQQMNAPGEELAPSPQAMLPPQQPTDARQAIAAAMGAGAPPQAPGGPQGAPLGPARPGVDVGAPGAVSPAGQRVLAAMMQQQPMTGGAPMPMQGVGGGLPSPVPPEAPQQVAQTAPAEDISQIPVMAGGTAGALPPGAAQAGPSIEQLMQAASDPWMNDQQRAIIGTMLQQKMQEADPLRQLQIQKARKELDTAPKQWQKLDDDTLFDPASGETRELGGTNVGQFRFEGTSVEAQSLNGLMDSGQLSVEQAQQIGAGKTITDPATGALIFMTPQGVFGQVPGGGNPQPIVPQAPAPQAPGSNAPTSPSAAPAGGTDNRPGMIPLTDPKAVKPTETQRNRVSAVDQAFEAINGELDRYSNLVKQTGIEAVPGEAKDNLNTVRQGIMLQMKELFNLGVLNGPDLSLMERMIYDPVVDPLKEGGLANLPGQALSAVTGDAPKRAQNSVDELKRMLTGIKASVGNSIPQNNKTDPAEGGWKDLGNGVRIRVKQ